MTAVTTCQIASEAKCIDKLADAIECQLQSCHPDICCIEKELCVLKGELITFNCDVTKVCVPPQFYGVVESIECLGQKALTATCDLKSDLCQSEINWCTVKGDVGCLDFSTDANEILTCALNAAVHVV